MLEDDGLLSPNDEIDLFALHYCFLPRINTHLKVFCQAYNHHRLRTEGNHSPMQLWLQGMLTTNDTTAASGVYDFEEMFEVYVHVHEYIMQVFHLPCCLLIIGRSFRFWN